MFIRFFFILLCFFCSFFQISTVFAGTKYVNKARFGQHDATSRFVLESKFQSVKPLKTFSLVSPPRFVIDFPETIFKVDIAHLNPPKNSLIKGVREGLFKPGVTRMVLDLKKPAKPKIFSLKKNRKNGHRLVIDLSPASKIDIARQKEVQRRIEKVKQNSKKRVPYIPVVKATSDIIVAIDAGHGGVDPGAVGKYKTYEKHITLAVAKKLAKIIDAKPGYKAYLTRNRDIFVELGDRVKKAQRVKADLFVSLHADAHRNRKVRGGSVYVLSDKSSDREAARLAAHANRGDLVAGIRMNDEPTYVQQILIDLTQRETMNKSALLAKEVLSSLKGTIKIRKDKVAFAGFRVLKAPEIPSVLVEMSYISNPEEERLLKNRRHQERIARSLAKGIEGYISKHHHN